MDKEKIKDKCFYFTSLLCMALLLCTFAYVYFMRTIEVDVISNAQYIYTGENGIATVEAVPKEGDLNERIQEFLDSCTYEITPDENLSNGDTIHVTATYDEELAEQYNYKAINVEADIVVEGLPNRFETLDDIDAEFLSDARQSARDYIKDHQDEIYALDGQGNDVKLTNYKLKYEAFLSSNASKNSDRMIYVFELTYNTEKIYYVVCIPNINDSLEIDEQNIYGEKAYLSETETMEANYSGYIERLYSSQYKIEARS